MPDGGRRDAAPSPAVRAAFGAAGVPVPLAGGRGTAWRAGDVVLKPLDTDPEALPWQHRVLGALVGRVDVRVAPPRPAVDGRWVVEGWTAWPWLAGEHVPGRPHEVIAAGARLHHALAGEPPPAFLAARSDRWAVADRVAWGDPTVASPPADAVVERLLAARRPVHGRPQLVHGDLGGNVLFQAGEPPAVIDLSPYWRPPAWASAVVLVDALLDEEADAEVLAPYRAEAELPQYLLRALVFRRVAELLAPPTAADPTGAVGRPDPHPAVADVVLRAAGP